MGSLGSGVSSNNTSACGVHSLEVVRPNGLGPRDSVCMDVGVKQMMLCPEKIKSNGSVRSQEETEACEAQKSTCEMAHSPPGPVW